MRWHSVHVHYYDDDMDALILDAVRPFFADMRDRLTAAYFVRHWQRGPHLRLNVRVDGDIFDEFVRPAASHVLHGYLADRPSQAMVDPQRWLAAHQRLAKLEHEDGPLLPWWPDNSVHFEPYDQRLHVLGTEAAADLLASFYADTTELTFAMLDHVRHGGQRLRLAFDLMIALAHAFVPGGVTHGFVSYRSHAEAFLSAWPEGIGQRPAWDQFYRRRAAVLICRVRDVVASVNGTGPAVPFVSAWTEALRPFERRAHDIVVTEASVKPADTVGQRSLAEVSDFHRVLAANESFERYVRPSLGFGVYRLVLNYTYLQLTRLGVTPVERFLLCHLAANTVEEAYGCSALDMIRQPYEEPIPSARLR